MGELALTIGGGKVTARLEQNAAEGPFEFELPSGAIEELSWLMERGPGPLAGPMRLAAERVTADVREWGDRLGAALRASADVAAIVDRALQPDPGHLVTVTIAAADPQVLALPWEVVPAGDHGALLADVAAILRVPTGPTHPPDNARASGDRVSVLMISPRPRGLSDVPLQPSQGPTIASAVSFADAMTLTVVRPPTVAALARTLEGLPPFDVIHFDGHGVVDRDGQGNLLFVDENGRQDRVRAADFANLIAAARPNTVLLNACRSAWSPPDAATPSIAATIASRLPRAAVVAMRYAVDPALVEALLSHFYPAFIETRNASLAATAARRALARRWAEDDRSVKAPAFLNLTVWTARPDDLVRTAGATASPPVDWKDVAWLSWMSELTALEAALDAAGDVAVISGAVGTGKTTLATAFANYSTSTGLCRQCAYYTREAFAKHGVAATTADTLHVLDINAGTAELAEIRAALPAPPGAANVIVSVATGRALPDPPGVHLDLPPQQVVGEALAPHLRPMMKDGPTGEHWDEGLWLLRKADTHLGTLACLVALPPDSYIGAGAERLEWDTDASWPLGAERIREVLDALPDEQADLLSVLGLFEGSTLPAQLAAVSERAAFVGAFGRPVGADEWRALFVAGANAGLFGLDEQDEPRVFAAIAPLIGLCLRERLQARVGERACTSLQRDMAYSTLGFLATQSPAPQGDTTVWQAQRWHRNALTLFESAATRALHYALRAGDDELATATTAEYVGKAPPGSEIFARGLEIAEHLLWLERRWLAAPPPRLYALLRSARAAAAERREDWARSLEHADAALAADTPDRVRAFPLARLHTMRARALWRLQRTAEAEVALAEAQAVAEDELQRIAIGSACDDFAQYRMLNPDERAALRELVGVADILPGPQVAAQQAERSGDHKRARDYWIDSLREAQQEGDAEGEVLGLVEAGRHSALHGDPREARARLLEALRLGEPLGIDPAPTFYYLAVAAERDDDLPAADDWLAEALQTESGCARTRVRGDCLNQRGVVRLRSEAYAEARDALAEARAIYAELQLGEYTADAGLMLGQAQMLLGDDDAARTELMRSIDLYGPGHPRTDQARELLDQLEGGAS